VKFKIRLSPEIFLLALALTIPAAGVRAQNTSSTNQTEQLAPGQMPYFDAVNDPIEGFNRCSWAVNNWIFRGIIYPLSLGYNVIAPKPVRTKISNCGHNLTYPVRLVNNCLQGKWKGAWEETKRFSVNSTVGLGGFFDPAIKWKIGRSDEDFGQTMGKWGSGPWFYLMIPIIGPSNGRDAVGKIVDYPLDICFWIAQAYDDEFWPKTIRPGITFNDLSGEAPDLKRRLDAPVDPYQAIRTLYSLNRQQQIVDYMPSVGGDFNPDPTLGAVLFKPVNENFANKAVTRRVLIPATGKKLSYSCWMQKKPAPLVCYLPGLGSYRLDRSAVAYADMLYRHGYSVVAISNPFQKEFMERGSTMAVPGYGPADCDDVVNDLKVILADVKKWKGDKITGTSLTGVSHGGYFTLMIAAREAAGKLEGMSFDRYVAVNPPVSLARALNSLDDLFNAPLSWPADEREQRMKVAIYKALYFAQNGLDVSGNIPLTDEESRFLIGLVFRYTLMGAIVDSQRRDNLGVLKVDPNKFVRQKSYREIRQINYAEYMNRFVAPYLIKTGRGTDLDALLAATDLTQSTASLRDNPKVRVQICEDDFLLKPGDIEWFHSTFGKNLTVYPTGGHLGNLHISAVQEALVRLFTNPAQ
jgi:phospholipid-binding lipoprotein MlaA